MLAELSLYSPAFGSVELTCYQAMHNFLAQSGEHHRTVQIKVILAY